MTRLDCLKKIKIGILIRISKVSLKCLSFFLMRSNDVIQSAVSFSPGCDGVIEYEQAVVVVSAVG